VNASTSGTGGGLWFDNASITGSILRIWSGATMGPTQGFACYTRNRINSQTQLRLRSLWTDSDVLN
jgi:hypothetical protein